MRKTLLLIALAIVLSGCVKVNGSNLKSTVSTEVNAAVSEGLPATSTMRKTLYSYYLPTSVGRREVSQSSTVLFSNNYNVLMNLDIVSVLSEKFYATESADPLRAYTLASEPLFKLTGTFKDLKSVENAYLVTVNAIEKNVVLLTLQTKYFVFSAVIPMAAAGEVAYDMMKIVRTCTINSDEVITLYSNRETFSYTKETLEIFSQLAPESGKIIDMIEETTPTTPEN